MTKQNVSILMMSAILCSCATSPDQDRASLSPRQVVEAISTLDGREVVVRGRLLFDPHARQLWEPGRSWDESDVDGCITLVNTGPVEALLERRNRQSVTLIGIARRDVIGDRIDYGACNEIGVEVVRILH